MQSWNCWFPAIKSREGPKVTSEYIQKIKIMASGPITSWEIDGETVETVSDFFGGEGLQNYCRW